MQPDLKVTTENGVKTIVIEYDRGDRDAAFELLRKALPAIEQLDQRTRQESQEEDHTA